MVVAKKSLGQHFLHDKNICRKIVDLLNIEENDTILEIGPGTGALTHILKDAPYSEFTILEKDDRFAQLHKENNYRNTKVIHIDALNFDWKSIDKKIKIISNLPYNVASPLMWDIVSLVPNLDRAVFMIQNEVADRCVAKVNTSTYGILSIWLQAFCVTEKHFIVSPRAFNPPPKVDSAVISLKTREKDQIPKYPQQLQELIKLLFSQRRKQIQGILKKSKFSAYSSEMLDGFNIAPTARAETIDVQTFMRLAEFLAKKMLKIQS